MTHLQAFQRKLANKSDAAIVSSPQNQFYLSHFPFSDGYLLVFPDEAYLVTDFRYAEAAEAKAAEGFTVLSPDKGPISEIKKLQKKRGVKTLLLEEQAVTLAEKARFSSAFEGVEFTDGGSAIFGELRIHKDAAELAAIERAQEITDAAFAHILDYIAPARTERDVALELEFFMRRNGAECAAFETIAVSGSASSVPHGTPRDVVLEKGFLTMDFGARFDGYCSDMTRTVMIGRADEEQKRLYNTVLTAQKAALAQIGGGMACATADKIARDIIENAGYHGRFGHSLGHGVGIDIHEAPALSSRARESSLLEPGHVVTVEPGIYIAGKYGCRIEDMVAVNDDGTIRDFTKSPKELIELCL